MKKIISYLVFILLFLLLVFILLLMLVWNHSQEQVSQIAELKIPMTVAIKPNPKKTVSPVDTNIKDELEKIADYQCAEKKTCSQIHSCAEAKYYLSQCTHKSLDRDKDGVPCEQALCNKKSDRLKDE
ncbi:MAG: hypothetical protein GQ569_02255 [Methylococcaceae bacterium]|nr:hypothetical protein [Methylococcaceae bacterium]